MLFSSKFKDYFCFLSSLTKETLLPTLGLIMSAKKPGSVYSKRPLGVLQLQYHSYGGVVSTMMRNGKNMSDVTEVMYTA